MLFRSYILFPDEGHGFARPENNIAFYAASEAFLAKCLGGRAEPYGKAFAGSSITSPYGAEFAPGFAEAFLASVLGGRAEPLDGELARSTAEIRTGEALVKGLAPA